MMPMMFFWFRVDTISGIITTLVKFFDFFVKNQLSDDKGTIKHDKENYGELKSKPLKNGGIWL